jgi:hypothetical protein
MGLMQSRIHIRKIGKFVAGDIVSFEGLLYTFEYAYRNNSTNVNPAPELKCMLYSLNELKGWTETRLCHPEQLQYASRAECEDFLNNLF